MLVALNLSHLDGAQALLALSAWFGAQKSQLGPADISNGTKDWY